MGALPDSANFNIYEAQNTEYPSETFLVNKSTGRIEKIGGGMEAMEQAIDIILSVERLSLIHILANISEVQMYYENIMRYVDGI